MSSRAEKILNNDFFINKEDLARQIISFEVEGKGYLPNNPIYKISPIYKLDNKELYIGRLHEYFYLGMKTEIGTTKHQLFENEIKCKQFFTNFDTLSEKQLAFWLNVIETLT